MTAPYLTLEAGTGISLDESQPDKLIVSATGGATTGASGQLANVGFPGAAEGQYVDFALPAAMTVTGWKVIVQPTDGQSSATISFDVLQATDAAYPAMTSLVGSGTFPGVTAGVHASGTPTGWTTTAIPAGNTLRVRVRSGVANVAAATLALSLSRT